MRVFESGEGWIVSCCSCRVLRERERVSVVFFLCGGVIWERSGCG